MSTLDTLTRYTVKAAAAGLLLAAGTSLLVAGGGTGPSAEAPVRLAQAAPATAAPAADTAASDVFDARQKAAIHDLIKDYLLKNPEIMLEVQSALESKMERLQADKLKVALQSNAKEIFHDADGPVVGNAKGDIPVVEFFDYNCGYCRKAFADVNQLVEKDGKVKLVLKELPILSKGSEEASRVALAARLQNLYWPVHRALFAIRGEVNEQTALKAVEKVPGIDMARLRKDMASEGVAAEIKRVRELASKMGIQGTPHFLVGDRAIPGAPQDLLQQMETNITELRKNGCPVC